MAYTTVPTIVSGDPITAAWGNTYIRDNFRYLKGTDGAITLDDALTIAGGLTAGSGSVGIVDSTGKIPAISSTYFASLSGTNLTNLPASQLTGALPAISGAALTELVATQIAAAAFPSGNFGFGMSPSYPVDVGGQARSQGFVTKLVTLANNATAQLCQTAVPDGFITIKESGNAGAAIYHVDGANHQVGEIFDWSGIFTGTAGTASSNNIYWSAGNNRYELENKRGIGLVTYIITLLGTV